MDTVTTPVILTVMLQAISTVGFPIVVAMFVLYRLNGKVERLALAMERVATHLDGVLGTKNGDHRDNPNQ